MNKKTNEEPQVSWRDKIEPKMISFLLLITRKDVLHIALAILVLIPLVTYTTIKAGDYSSLFDLTLFSTILIEAMIVGIVSLVHKKLLNHTEDPQKLESDYQKLVRRYSAEDSFIWKRNGEVVDVIPVILDQWLYDIEIEIKDEPDHRYTLPNEIIKYYEDLFYAHLTSKVFNSTTIRVNDWNWDNKQKRFIIHSGRTTYYNSLVTNRAVDYPINNGISVRELFECGPFVHPINHSLLSNHLGFNGFVISSDDEVMFVFRKKNISIGKRTWGDSVEASLKTKYALNENYEFTLKGLKKGIVLEIVDELGIPRDSLKSPDSSYNNNDLGPIRLIAAYRDMLEGGKPQLLFCTRTSLTKDQINKVFNDKVKNIPTTSINYDRVENEKEMETDGDVLHWYSLEEIRRLIVKSDGIGLEINNMLPMVPSASACVAMFIRYLNHVAPKKTEEKDEFISYNMRVCKQEVKGKTDNYNLCEDAVFVGKRFVAVIDGVTSKGKHKYQGKTSGKRASEVLREAFEALEMDKEEYKSEEFEVLKYLNNALKAEMDAQHCELSKEDYLRAAVIYFDRKEKIVVSYGDCNCRIGSDNYYHNKKIDDINAEKRAKILEQCLSKGMDINDLRKDDPGRAGILNDMIDNLNYENASVENGYPVLNGHSINKDLMIVHKVYEAQRVVLCSDGYPEICDTYEKSEEKLREIIEKDPLLIGDYKSTKGVAIGANSFDDRTWVEIGAIDYVHAEK